MIGDVEVRDAGSKGKGVFAKRGFQPGDFIFRRRHGHVVENRDIPTLSLDDQRHLCELDHTTSAILLPPGCYLNHSCSPNAMRSGVKVFAWQPMTAGDEITVDYRLNAFDDDKTFQCECGSDECSGVVVASFFGLAAEKQRLYLPYAPPFIRRDYKRRRRTA